MNIPKAIFFFFLILSTSLPIRATEQEIFVLENPSDSGMFAVFGSVIGAVYLYETGSFKGVHIDLNSGRYLDPAIGPNWWEYFFEPIIIGNQSLPKHYCSIDEYYHVAAVAFHKGKDYVCNLIKKYIHPKPHIKQEVDTFVNKHFKNRFVIGVHHRGTDKIEEWPLVPYKETHNQLKSVIKGLSKKERSKLTIYVATDDTHFLEYLRVYYPYEIVYNEFSRSSGNTPLHAYGANFYSSNYQMGKEALLDCLLLSKSNILIRPSSSCLSSVASFFNRDMTVISLQGQ